MCMHSAKSRIRIQPSKTVIGYVNPNLKNNLEPNQTLHSLFFFKIKVDITKIAIRDYNFNKDRKKSFRGILNLDMQVGSGYDLYPNPDLDRVNCLVNVAAEGRRSTVWTRQPNSFIPANSQVDYMFSLTIRIVAPLSIKINQNRHHYYTIYFHRYIRNLVKNTAMSFFL